MDPLTNPQPQQPTNVTMPPPMAPMPKQKSSFGPIIGIIIIIALLVLGAFYFWGSTTLDQQAPATETQPQATDSTSAIESDLNASVNSSFDSDLQELDAELQNL